MFALLRQSSQGLPVVPCRKRRIFASLCDLDTPSLADPQGRLFWKHRWLLEVFMYSPEPAILYWLKKKAREGRAREDGDRTIFRVPLLAQFFLLSGALVLMFVEILMFSIPDTPLWQEMVLVPILLLLLFCGPGSIILDSTGVSKRNLLGLRRTIPWQDVRTLDLVARRQLAYVGRGTGLRMQFTAYHVDLRRFVEEVRRRAPGVNFTSDL